MLSAFTIGLIVDIVIILIFALNMLLGYFKGFIKTIFGFLTLAASFFISYTFAKPLTDFLKTTDIYGNIFESLSIKLTAYFDKVAEGRMEQMIAENSSEAASIIERFGRSFADVSAEYTRLAAEKSSDIMEGLVSYIIEPACDAIITALCFIAIFIVSYIALRIISSVLDLAAKLPILRTCNRLLGLLLGACVAFIQVIFLTAIIDAILPYFDTASLGITVSALRNSGLYTWFASLNPVGAVFNKS